jgi:hypothetical protein
VCVLEEEGECVLLQEVDLKEEGESVSQKRKERECVSRKRKESAVLSCAAPPGISKSPGSTTMDALKAWRLLLG